MTTLADVSRLTDAAKAALEARDDAIRAALETNSVRAVASAAGLSPARIHQIGQRR